MRTSIPLVLLSVAALLALAPAHAAPNKAAVGDVVLYHLGEVDRPAIVLDLNGPVIRLFLTAEDSRAIDREEFLDAQSDLDGHGPKPRATPAHSRAHGRSGARVPGHPSDGVLRGPDSVTFVPAADDWSPR